MKILRLWVLPDAGLETVSSLRRPLALFQKQFPDCRVEVTVRRLESLWGSLMGRLKRSGPADGVTSPDVIEIPSHWTSPLAYLGLLEDLSDLGPIDPSRWLPELRPQMILEGTPRVFSMPWWMEVLVLYYREDVLRRRRLDGEKELSDWEGLRRICRRLSAPKSGRDLVPLAPPNFRESITLADVASSVWSNGGDFFSEDGSHSLLHREELVAGIRTYVELFDQGWMPFADKLGAASGTVFDRRAALQFSGRYPRRIDRALSSAIRAVEAPASSARIGFSASYHLAVPSPAQHAREAFGLAACLTESASAYAEAAGGFGCAPSWSEALNDRRDLKAVFERAYRSARRLPNRTAIGSLERIFERAMERLLRSVLRGTYQEQGLREELLYAKAEMDYVLSMPLEPAGA